MSVIYLLLALSICVAIVFFVVFLLSVKRGQYDDLHSPAVRMLFEDELVEKTSNNLTSKNQKS